MMNKQFKRNVLGGAIASILAVPAVAQQTEDEAQQTVVVTGTRISRPSDFNNANPVDVVDRASIEKAGYANLQQLMEKMPSNGNGAFSTRGNNQDSTANGAASISLRGLGADATLVLVNGRRVAIAPSPKASPRTSSTSTRSRSPRSSASKCSRTAPRRCMAPTPSPA